MREAACWSRSWSPTPCRPAGDRGRRREIVSRSIPPPRAGSLPPHADTAATSFESTRTPPGGRGAADAWARVNWRLTQRSTVEPPLWRPPSSRSHRGGLRLVFYARGRICPHRRGPEGRTFAWLADDPISPPAARRSLRDRSPRPLPPADRAASAVEAVEDLAAGAGIGGRRRCRARRASTRWRIAPRSRHRYRRRVYFTALSSRSQAPVHPLAIDLGHRRPGRHLGVDAT